MRKTWGVTILLFVSVITSAQVYWDGGGGDDQWSTALNWSTDAVPDSASLVILDNGIITGNYTVMLPAGDISTRVLSLTITPAASRSITLLLPSSNTAMNGFVATGPGDGVVLNPGAVFRNASGASSGVPVSVVSTNFFRINNGGRYIHNTARPHTEFLVSRLSTAPGTEDGIFEFDVPSTASYTISVSNRNYGHLVLSANAAGGVKTYSASGNNRFTIRGDLEINTNTVLSYGANTDTILIQKNCIVYPGAVFNISNSSNNAVVNLRGNLDIRGILTESGNSTGSVLLLNGSSTQAIQVTGSVTNTVDVSLDNPTGGFLLSTLTLPYRLTITQGNLVLGNNDLITPFINQTNPPAPSGNHIVTNGIGMLRMPAITNGVFPVGPDATHYNPVHVTAGGGAEYAVRVETGINPAISNPFPAVVNRTWFIHTTLVPANTAAIKLGFNTGDWVNNFDTGLPVDLGQWINGGWSVARANLPVVNTGAQPAYETTFDNVSSFNTGFIIGNHSFGLPHNFLVCDGKIMGQTAQIRWRINDDTHATGFELQRAGNDSMFHTIATISSTPGKHEYIYQEPLARARLLYRVKARMQAGEERLSNTIVLTPPGKGIWLRSVVPNPVSDHAWVHIEANKSARIALSLINMSGITVRRWNLYVTKGANASELDFGGLSTGYYTLVNHATANVIMITRQ